MTTDTLDHFMVECNCCKQKFIDIQLDYIGRCPMCTEFVETEY